MNEPIKRRPPKPRVRLVARSVTGGPLWQARLGNVTGTGGAADVAYNQLMNRLAGQQS